MRRIFVSGGTGFIGQAVVPRLIERGHQVTALVRKGSETKVPARVSILFGDALDAQTFCCDGADTFLHLVGTAHPAPWKSAEFRAIDLSALRASIEAAVRQGCIKHFIFLSVAQPAPIMRAYIEVRADCERLVEDSGKPATFVRPWYVLGKGRSWPLALKPLYALAELLPTTRDGALRLGLVTLEQMVETIVAAVDRPPAKVRILDVPAIRSHVIVQ